MELLSELLLGRTAIREVPASIGRLIGISLLDLHSCENLVGLPDSVTEMKKLKVLILKGCSKLATFPENLNRLEELDAGNTAIWQLPGSIGNLSKLKVLSLRRGRKVSAWSLMLPIALNGLLELKRLDLSGCNISWKEVYTFRYLVSLVELNLSRNKLTSLPIIAELPLRYLNITHCQELKELPQLPLSIMELYAEDFLAAQSTLALWTFPRLHLVSFTNYCFDQQSYTEKNIDNSIFDQIVTLFLSDAKGTEDFPYPGRSSYRGTSIVFPGCAIPTWFKYQSLEEKILFKLPEGWCDDNVQGFAICCVTCMGAGVYAPDSGLSGKYDYSCIKATLMCSNNPEKLRVLVKECKVGTASRTYSWCICFVYIPLYCFWHVSWPRDDKITLNQYDLFDASIDKRIARQWGVHLIYKADRQIFKSRIDEALLGLCLGPK